MPVSAATWLVMVQPWPEVGERLAREIIDFGEFKEGQELLSIGGGEGRFAIWAAERYRAHVEALDPDSAAVARGEAAARRVSLAMRPRIQQGSPVDLPHESAVFDGAIADFLTLGAREPAQALAEAGRVLRPYARMVVLAPVWHEPPPPRARELLASQLGLTAHLLVEWKRWMRTAGLVEITAHGYPPASWADTSRTSAVIRGWRVARWRGVRAALSPGATLFWNELAERRLGLILLRGVRWPDQPADS